MVCIICIETKQPIRCTKLPPGEGTAGVSNASSVRADNDAWVALACDEAITSRTVRVERPSVD